MNARKTACQILLISPGLTHSAEADFHTSLKILFKTRSNRYPRKTIPIKYS